METTTAKPATRRFPSIAAVRTVLASEQRTLRRLMSRDELMDDEDSTPGTDCRLRVMDNGNWQILTGSSDYDQDHRGFWGASFLPYDRANLTHLARELIDEAKDSEAMSRE